MSTTTEPPSALIFIRTTIGLPPGLSCVFSAGGPSKRREGHARNSNSLLPPGNRPEIRARAHRPRVASSRNARPRHPLTPKHGIRYTLRLSLRWRLRLKLTPRRRRDRTIRRTIGDALECVCNSRQLQCNLVGSFRPLQHDNPFPAEVKSAPKQQPNHDRHTRHERVVTCDRDAPTRDSNHVIREQGFLPAGVNRVLGCN